LDFFHKNERKKLFVFVEFVFVFALTVRRELNGGSAGLPSKSRE
jgi:hypothetical protein